MVEMTAAETLVQFWYWTILVAAALAATAAATFFIYRRNRELKRSWTELETARDRLEKIVRERTSYLERANEELRKEVAEREQAEEGLRASEERYRTMIENSNDMIWMLDTRANFTHFNRRAEEISGYGLEEWRGKSFAPLIPKEDLPRVQKIFMETLAGRPQQYEVGFYAKGGNLVLLSVNTTPIIEKGSIVGTVSFGRDITERKRAEEALHASEERFRALFESAPDAYILLDTKGRLMDANSIAEKSFGYTREELLGKSIFEAGLLLPEQLKRAKENFARRMRGEPVGPQEYGLKRKDGSTLPAEVNILPVSIKGERLMLTIIRDITERKKAESVLKNYAATLEADVKKRTWELLAEKKKVEALLGVKDEFIRGISHELKTPLSVIMGNLVLLKESFGKKPPKAIELIERNAGRLGSSINNILELSVIGAAEVERERVGLDGILGEIYREYAPLGELKGLKVALDAKPAAVVGDAKLLRLAISNLVSNAIRFTKKGRVAIRLRPLDGGASVSVSDTGIGISRKNQKRLFERFFKADPRTPGTGIGLSIAREIINKHGGEIRFKSALGKGSTFEIILPSGAGK